MRNAPVATPRTRSISSGCASCEEQRRQRAVSWPCRQSHETECAWASDNLELEAYADRRHDSRGMQKAVGQTARHLAVHDTEVAVEALAHVQHTRYRVDVFRAAAVAGLVGRAAGVGAGGVAVLLDAIVGCGRLESRGEHVFDTRPVDLLVLVP